MIAGSGGPGVPAPPGGAPIVDSHKTYYGISLDAQGLRGLGGLRGRFQPPVRAPPMDRLLDHAGEGACHEVLPWRGQPATSVEDLAGLRLKLEAFGCARVR